MKKYIVVVQDPPEHEFNLCEVSVTETETLFTRKDKMIERTQRVSEEDLKEWLERKGLKEFKLTLVF